MKKLIYILFILIFLFIVTVKGDNLINLDDDYFDNFNFNMTIDDVIDKMENSVYFSEFSFQKAEKVNIKKVKYKRTYLSVRYNDFVDAFIHKYLIFGFDKDKRLNTITLSFGVPNIDVFIYVFSKILIETYGETDYYKNNDEKLTLMWKDYIKRRVIHAKIPLNEFSENLVLTVTVTKF